MLYLRKLEVLAYGGLGGVLNSSLATKKLCFGSLVNCSRRALTAESRKKRRWGKSTFSGLGESSDVSLDTERTSFRQLKGISRETTIR